MEAGSHEANPLQRLRQYVLDVRTEFEKITWPSQKEYVGGTVGVLIIVALMTIVLGGLDAVFSWGFEKVIQLLNG